MGHYFYCITLLFSLVSSYSIFGQKSVVFDADEINASVTIKTDQWGVSHIYAANERALRKDSRQPEIVYFNLKCLEGKPQGLWLKYWVKRKLIGILEQGCFNIGGIYSKR